MASHNSPTILERALQALREYERNQTGSVFGAGLPFVQPTPRLTAVQGEPILTSPLPAENDAAASQIFQWVKARCARRDGAWGAEQFLWRDYEAWSQRNKVSVVVTRGQFAEMLDQFFRREMDGWQGIALVVDVVASGRYIM
ncbi:MAG: hypothetical protein WBQ13_02610 [Terriglobales bacterium]